VNSVADAKAEWLVQECSRLGMQEVPYQPVVADSNLRPFDEGHHLRFSVAGANALFEILERDGAVVQAGFQITFPRSVFFSKAKRHHLALRKALETHYGIGQPMDVGTAQIVNFANESTVAYISRVSAAGMDAITVRVGNRTFWR
jgi:hypothetical protein